MLPEEVEASARLVQTRSSEVPRPPWCIAQVQSHTVIISGTALEDIANLQMRERIRHYSTNFLILPTVYFTRWALLMEIVTPKTTNKTVSCAPVTASASFVTSRSFCVTRIATPKPAHADGGSLRICRFAAVQNYPGYAHGRESESTIGVKDHPARTD